MMSSYPVKDTLLPAEFTNHPPHLKEKLRDCICFRRITEFRHICLVCTNPIKIQKLYTCNNPSFFTVYIYTRTFQLSATFYAYSFICRHYVPNLRLFVIWIMHDSGSETQVSCVHFSDLSPICTHKQPVYRRFLQMYIHTSEKSGSISFPGSVSCPVSL